MTENTKKIRAAMASGPVDEPAHGFIAGIERVLAGIPQEYRHSANIAIDAEDYTVEWTIYYERPLTENEKYVERKLAENDAYAQEAREREALRELKKKYER